MQSARQASEGILTIPAVLLCYPAFQALLDNRAWGCFDNLLWHYGRWCSDRQGHALLSIMSALYSLYPSRLPSHVNELSTVYHVAGNMSIGVVWYCGGVSLYLRRTYSAFKLPTHMPSGYGIRCRYLMDHISAAYILLTSKILLIYNLQYPRWPLCTLYPCITNHLLITPWLHCIPTITLP